MHQRLSVQVQATLHKSTCATRQNCALQLKLVRSKTNKHGLLIQPFEGEQINEG
jgi:hypothetical protein